MVFKMSDVNLSVGEKRILSNINISFEKNQFNAIIGPNGSGKSSLIKLFARLSKPTSGKILFLNEDLNSIKRREFAKQVAFFFQFNADIDEMTVSQLVSFGRRAYKKLYENLSENDFNVINDAIEKCDLIGYEEMLISNLSGGEKQRVYLAMTLAQEPDIIVLDEPTNHLDIKYQYQLLSLLYNIMHEQNLTIICILHDFNQVLKYAKNTVLMKDGEIYASGKTEEVITVNNVENVFEVKSIIHKDKNGYHIDFIV